MPRKRELTERDVVAFLDSMKIPHSNLGFLYLVKAIRIACHDEDINTKRRVMVLYDRIAKECQTTPGRVERAIRSRLRRESCGMTNGQFIFWASDKLMYDEPAAPVSTSPS